MKFRLNDMVVVVTGSHKGQSGEITKVSKDNRKVVVNGVNRRVKNVKAQGGQPGQRVEFFASIDVSNIAIVDPKSGKPTKIAYKYEDGKKLRVAKASGEVIGATAKAVTKKTTK